MPVKIPVVLECKNCKATANSFMSRDMHAFLPLGWSHTMGVNGRQGEFYCVEDACWRECVRVQVWGVGGSPVRNTGAPGEDGE